MKIIIILIICLFFSLSITPINELFVPIPPQTTGPTPQQAQSPQTTGPTPQQPQIQPQSDGSLQSQINMLSTQLQQVSATANQAKADSSELKSQLDKFREEFEQNK